MRERIREVQETVDEQGNQVLGDLPQIVGDTIAWPLHPTQQQLNATIGEELTRFVQERGDLGDVERVSTEFVLEERLPAVQEEEEEPMVGPLELALAMVLANRVETPRLENPDLD